MRKEEVERQLRVKGIRDEKVLTAMLKVPRHVFVPEDLRGRSEEDGPLPIGFHQTISQPYIVAFMTEALQLNKTDRVLEIGTGSGYQTAILAELGNEVYTLEILEPLQLKAEERLKELGYRNIHFRTADGWQGWPEAAPFDKIIVTAAAAEIPKIPLEQLRENGRMVVPVGVHSQNLIVGVKEAGELKAVDTVPVRFVPLVKNKMKGNEQ